MAIARLVGKIVIQGVTPVNATTWDVDLIYTDSTGAFLADSVQANDRIAIDTSGAELGTVSRYKILSVMSANPGTGAISCRVEWDDNNVAPISPDVAIFIPGVIGRPTPNKSLNVLPEPASQQMDPFVPAYARNADFIQRLDSFTNATTYRKQIENGATGATMFMVPEGLTFIPNNTNLLVYSDGILMDPNGNDYTEGATGASIAFVTGRDFGTKITFVWSK